ncbi:MAG: baeR [Anaerolineales bacterium]|jgi:two-component system OmpR family response regulator|nr:baeR [Anaerolineales bacterium]MBM2849115.1 baeR [Anaerolineales bacterium]
MPLILIVDDDPDMAELLGHMTDILDYEHQYVPTGAEALEACRTNPPDAIVLDVMLEETDGWAVFRQLMPITNAPIIFITAWRTGENRLKAEAMRADGFLAKPISHQDFAAQLKAVLGKPARRLSRT